MTSQTTFNRQHAQYLDDLASLRGKNASEDAIRAAFLRFLGQAFPGLQASEINLEQHIPLSAHSAGAEIQHGFADAVYGKLIFEFKRALDEASRAKGEGELKKYLSALPDPERHFGLLTDGETVRVYDLRESELNLLDDFKLEAEKADDAYLRLDTYLFHAQGIRPNARDVALRFGERSPVFWGSYRLLHRLWTQEGHTAATHTKFTQWQNLLAVVYGSPIGDEELFLRHTYLVYLARLLAFAVIEQRVPSAAEATGIITGEVFRQMGFPDFVADDFFAWVAAPALRGAVADWLSGVSVLLGAAYDLLRIDEDLLKALYQELVDPVTRHDLGEHYTPDWLAELTLEEAGYPLLDPKKRPIADEHNRLLDPASGSGTFLFIAIRRLRRAGLKGAALVNFVQHHMAGMDVHPLAVVIAKANLLLALGADLRQARGEVRLPIYMANALEVAQKRPLSYVRVSVDVANLSHLTGKPANGTLPDAFHLPFAADAPAGYLDEAIEALITYANPELDEDTAKQSLESVLNRLIPDQAKVREQWSYWLGNLRLMRWLLQEPATDSVWRFILQNAFRPQLLAHRGFAFVVGNPPWLAYRYIQSRTFQDTVRKLVFEHGLAEKNKSHLFTQMDTSTLFFAFALWRYVAVKGTLAFVMPRSVLTGAKQHRAFQEQYLQRARSILDCKGVTPLFPVPACVVVAKFEDRRRKVIPVRSFSGDLPGHNLSWEMAAPHLEEKRESFRLLEAGQESPYLASIINGANLYPRNFWFARTPPIAKVINRQKPHLETDPAINKQAKAPWKGLSLKGPVEAPFLYATLLSDNLLPFGARNFSLVVLPLKKAHLLSEQEATRAGNSGLAEWLEQAQGFWKKHGKSESDLLPYMNWQNKITRQRPVGGYRVIMNKSGTYITACVITVPEPLKWEVNDLSAQGLIADNTTFYYDTNNADEAHYLASYLNAPAVDAAIKPYQSEGAFGAQSGGGQRDICRRPFEVLPWPLYNPKDKRHQRLASLGRKAHEKVADWLATAPEKDRSAPTGKLRSRLRAEVLESLLKQIDELVDAVLADRTETPKAVKEGGLFE
jgi:hypothetical protein